MSLGHDRIANWRIVCLDYHRIMVFTWLPVSVAIVGTVGSLSAFAWQVRRARFNQSIDLLFRLENDFFGPAKRAQRVKAAGDLLTEGRFLEVEPILDFFETIALLLRRGALDREVVWHTFFYWIDRYYQACREHIVQRQQRDPLVWKDLTVFVADLRKYQSSQAEAGRYTPPSSEEVDRFLHEELTEAV